MPVLTYKPSKPPAEMVRRRQARPLGNGAYEVISRNGKVRYRVHVLPGGATVCNCTAGRADVVCWHALRALKRHEREHTRG
jgi:hypothetical protein